MNNTARIRDTVFANLGVAPKLMTILNKLQIIHPTPIQQKAIPIAATGKDVIGIAQTGTGKTLAFALPMLQQIAATKKQGFIILPTRELAMQVNEVFTQLGKSLHLRCALLIGGSSIEKQKNDVHRNPHIIIGTPGRINDHLNHHSLRLEKIGILVLDEADRMLDMGFAPQIKRILQHIPTHRQTMLFSATMPAEILKIASAYMKSPVRIEIAQSGTVADRIEQELFLVHREQKNRLLHKLLKDYSGTVLVFARTKYGAKKICRAVRGMGFEVAEIHSNLSLSQRRRSLEGFKSGRFRVLIATDIASRGIDVNNIELVINYDIPDNLDDYVHRIGRTGRAGCSGQAISFITHEQRGKVRHIERIVRQSLRISPLPELPAEMPNITYQANSYKGQRGRNTNRRWQQQRSGGRKKVRVHH